MQILVTGATGAVGPAVVSALLEAGHRVRSLAVDPPGSGDFPPEAEAVIGDILDEATLRGAVSGADAVIHMAALLHIPDPRPEMRGRYEQVNVEGTRAVVRAACQAGAGRIALFSTIAVYGPTGGRILDETSPVRPDTLYGETKLAAERIVLDARDSAGRPVGTVLRLGAVYGPRIKGNYARLTSALARRRFVPVGDGSNRRSLVHEEDVGRAAALAVAHPGAAGLIFNVTDGGLPAMRDIIAAICAALGRRPPRLSLPAGPLRVLAGAAEAASRAAGLKPPVTRAAVDKLMEDCAVDGGRIRRELGFAPRYDLWSGWRQAVGGRARG